MSIINYDNKNRLVDSPIVILITFLIAVVSGATLNILSGVGIVGVDPLVVNATRTLVATGILTVVAVLLSVPLRVNIPVFWRYFVVAMLTMAIPHSLIFIGRCYFGVSATSLSLIEAAIVGIILVYLLTEGNRISKKSVVLGIMTIGGLIVFINPVGLMWGDVIILIAAVVTALGMILNEKIKPPTPVNGGPSATPYLPALETSMRKTTISTASSGVVVLLVVGLVNLVCVAFSKPTIQVAASPLLANWGLILALAIAGSILTWFSLFLLIELGHLFLAASAIAAAPVVTELYKVFWAPPSTLSKQQWIGGLVIMASLAGLIWIQLGRNRTPQ